MGLLHAKKTTIANENKYWSDLESNMYLTIFGFGAIVVSI